MGITDDLRRGMTVEDVRKLLRGWREALPSALLSPDKTHLYYTIDFVPQKAAAKLLRLTFDNGKLIIWGEPANAADPGAARAG